MSDARGGDNAGYTHGYKSSDCIACLAELSNAEVLPLPLLAICFKSVFQSRPDMKHTILNTSTSASAAITGDCAVRAFIAQGDETLWDYSRGGRLLIQY
jgi:hypothetical protein